MSETDGGNLFIVDNSVSGWTGLEYLRQWSDLARSFDIATGFFEIGALLALHGDWQKLEKIRLLMGDEVSLRTKAVFTEALRKRVDRLNDSLEHEKRPNPFLEGVEEVVEAIADGRIECRVYRRDKFHAKTYITHAKFDVVGAQALVGSSNFTSAGLTRNIELNIQVQSGREVAQLQDWPGGDHTSCPASLSRRCSPAKSSLRMQSRPKPNSVSDAGGDPDGRGTFHSSRSSTTPSGASSPFMIQASHWTWAKPNAPPGWGCSGRVRTAVLNPTRSP